ncbi:gamma-glutamyl kinase [Polaribacter irgensii 23-P]|uniref:Gamma-glutamyl kinase n=2 Tax=Polaribacter TaxID=52959 RepID=A4C1S4_9FLAO|nr:gamma-glutamyl kinase [Polaribacter irgensii 23-P]
MADPLNKERAAIIKSNKEDMARYTGADISMLERLKVAHYKVDEMIFAAKHLAAQEDLICVECFSFKHDNGLQVDKKTASFGSVLIIYESRSDITQEAAGIAFKSRNKILLKGGKESLKSNLKIVDLWHTALKQNDAALNWVTYLPCIFTEMVKCDNMQEKKRILIKIGSHTLTKETDNISRGKIEDMANQIAKLKDTCEFIIVSSGAIAVAKQFVKLESKQSRVFVRPALASIGQPHLIRIYQEIFREYGLLSTQCLLSYSDFEKLQSKTNIVNTINVLVHDKYIPIINKNETVATDEIQFGDNEKLAAFTAVLLEVDLLIIATNTYGIYTKESLQNKHPKTIFGVINLDTLKNEVVNSKSSHGSGGMHSKIEAATLSQKAQIETRIVNGLEDNFITNAFGNKVSFTKIK